MSIIDEIEQRTAILPEPLGRKTLEAADYNQLIAIARAVEEYIEAIETVADESKVLLKYEHLKELCQ